jgi:hypothetical protein
MQALINLLGWILIVQAAVKVSPDLPSDTLRNA